MKLLRVFPRKTNATPEDENVRFGLPTLFDEADEIHISVSWTWDKPKAEKLAKEWSLIAPVKIGGPAYDDPGSEFTPGLYLRLGYVITSRGCPNHCYFCSVPKREGSIRELTIKDGWTLLDNNLLACSRSHIEGVFQMLERQKKKHKPIRFTGGLEAARLEEWHVKWLSKLKPQTVWFAYDTPGDLDPLINATALLRQYDLFKHSRVYRCYVLIGWKNDTIEKAEKRLLTVAKLGLMPMAMLYDHGLHRQDKSQWIPFAREWANPWIVGSKMQTLNLQ